LSARPFGGVLAPYQRLAHEVAARHAGTPDREPLKGDLERGVGLLGRQQLDALARPMAILPAALTLPLLPLNVVAALGLACVVFSFVLRRPPVLWLSRAETVDRRGVEATRIRAALRTMVGWLPIFALFALRDDLIVGVFEGSSPLLIATVSVLIALMIV